MFSNEVRMEILPYMTASYVLNMFNAVNERPITVMIRRSKYKNTEGALVFFPNDDVARHVVTRLNGKPLPDLNKPQYRFKLVQGVKSVHPEYCIWVRDLTPDVDDYQLYKFFVSRYNSVFYAKVTRSKKNPNKNFGLIKFVKEEEQHHCLRFMNYSVGLGSNPLQLSSVEISDEDTEEKAASPTDSQQEQQQQQQCPFPENNLLDVKSVNGEENRKQSNEETEIFRRLEEKYLQWNSVDTFNTDVPYLMSSMKTEEESIYDYNTAEQDNLHLQNIFIETDYHAYDKGESMNWIPFPALSTVTDTYSYNTMFYKKSKLQLD